jgi:hypothetical protein
MKWIGKWRNQYGSIADITDDADNEIRGTFTTALQDSGFYGQTVPGTRRAPWRLHQLFRSGQNTRRRRRRQLHQTAPRRQDGDTVVRGGRRGDQGSS